MVTEKDTILKLTAKKTDEKFLAVIEATKKSKKLNGR